MSGGLQYRFRQLLSGIEAGRHYNPAALIADFGWTVQEERQFRDGTVTALRLGRTALRQAYGRKVYRRHCKRH